MSRTDSRRVAPFAEAPWRVLLAIAALCVSLVVIDQGLRRSVAGEAFARANMYAEKARELAERARTDVLITGDSRILHGLYPREIADVVALERGRELALYNAALPGAPPMAQFAMVLRALSAAQPPQLVLVALSPYMFSSRIVRSLARESLQTVWRIRDIPHALEAGASADDVADIIASNAAFGLRYRPQWLDLWLRARPLPGPVATGELGFVGIPGVDLNTQASRARQRALGYRTELIKPEAQFGNEHQGYFEAMLALLQKRKVRVVVLGTPSSTAIATTEGADSIYAEHVAYVAHTTQKYGARFVDLEHDAPIVDRDFTDGDHLSVAGARRLSAFVAQHVVGPVFGTDVQVRADCRTLFDFETSLDGFVRTGLDRVPVRRTAAPPATQPIYGQHGAAFLSTVGEYDADGPEGALVSPPFVLDGATLRVRVGGGVAPLARVELWVADERLAVFDGGRSEALRARSVDVRKFSGKLAELRVIDASREGWGHISVDDVALCQGGIDAP